MTSVEASRADELGLFADLVRTGDPRLRDELVAAHLGLAHQLARRFDNRGESHDDLVQVASLALVKAVDRFDPERGVTFSTFAVKCILGELKRHFRDRGWAVRAPRRIQELYLEIGQHTDRLTQELGRAPTVPELAGAVGASVDAVLEALEAGRGYRASSLDEPDRDSQTLAATLGVDDGGFASVENRAVLQLALQELPEKDQLLLSLRFVEGLTQAQIAERFGVSQMQVSRVLAANLRRLRGAFFDDGRQSLGA